jgi:hypothetical protein
MKKQDLEYKILELVDIVKDGKLVEDQTVELKSRIPTNANKTARQLAGHANSARAEGIIWIIGLDEEEGVVGVDKFEIADWWPSVNKHFSSTKPTLETVAAKEIDKATVIGLYFRTNEAPYLVNNPNGGTIAREVPWREGNSTRTARRDDLLRLLVPMQYVPDIDVLKASVDVTCNMREQVITVSCELYIYSSTEYTLTVPYHRCIFSVTSSDEEEQYEIPVLAERGRLNNINKYTNGSLIKHTMREAIVQGSGLCVLMGKRERISKTVIKKLGDQPIALTIGIYCHELDRSLDKMVEFGKPSASTANQVQWRYSK